MIYLLDTHPTKCASYYAVDHLKSTTKEAIQVLSDATRVLIEECRIHSMERKMKDARAEVRPEEHYTALDHHVPRKQRDVDDPLVLWCVEDQDAWDWMLEFTADLINETRNWFGKGPDQEDIDAACWLRVNAPRPVNAGRILPRGLVFPLPPKIPKECTTPDLFAPDVPTGTKKELTVRAFRVLYWMKHRNVVQYTRTRRPWWWASFDHTLAPVLASGRPEK